MPPPAAASQERQHIPALDGIRAIAVLGVLVYHTCASALPGGFLGVDVFFVLSGFLITSIIHGDIQRGSFSLKEFYLRRIQRLLPNAVLTIIVTMLPIMFYLPSGSENISGRHGLWTLFSLSNFFAYRTFGDYWGPSAENAVFTHFWSLGVEEQFYLIFPGLFLLGCAFFKRRLPALLTLLALLSLGFCIYASRVAPVAAFYLPVFRFWELIAGAILAIRLNIFGSTLGLTGNKKVHAGMCAGGVILIFLSFVLPNKSGGFPMENTLLVVCGTVLLIHSCLCRPNGLAARLLASAPMTLVGRLSYSIYLWHWPAIILTTMVARYKGLSELPAAILGAFVGVACATLAYYGVERPMRRRGPGRVKRLVLLALLFVSATGLCLTACITRLSENPNFEPVVWRGIQYGRKADVLNAMNRQKNRKKVVFPSDNGTPYFFYRSPRIADVRYEIPREELPRTSDNEAVFSAHNNGRSPEVVLWGSSVATMYAPTVDAICRDKNIPAAFYCGEGWFIWCNMPGKTTPAFQQKRLEWLRDWRPKTLLLADEWQHYGEEELLGHLSELLEETRSFQTRIIFVGQIPTLKFGENENLRSLVTFLSREEKTLPSIGQNAERKTQRMRTNVAVEKLAKNNPRLQVITMDELFLKPDGTVHYAEGRVFFYADDNHLCETGAQHVRPLLENSILNLSETLD